MAADEGPSRALVTRLREGDARLGLAELRCAFVDIFAVVTAVGGGSSSPAEGAMTLA